MTWEAKDLRQHTPSEDRPQPLPPIESLPRQEVLARLDEAEEALEAIPREVQREMVQAGLVDEVTWARWRLLMTRGVYAL